MKQARMPLQEVMQKTGCQRLSADLSFAFTLPPILRDDL